MDHATNKTTLCIDIGGTNTKALRCDARANAIDEPVSEATPPRADVQAVMDLVARLATRLPGFDRVSVGFPGVVRGGVTHGAVNLGEGWTGFPLAQRLAELLSKPVQVANDADVQGLGAIGGRGVELVLTFGTGLGSALFLDGSLIPNLELGHMPFENGRSYEETVCDRALRDLGIDEWRRGVARVLGVFERAFNPDRFLFGGGNARHLTRSSGFDLPPNAVCVCNDAGLTGGVALWGGVPPGRSIPRLEDG